MSTDEKICVLIAHGNPLVAAGLEAAFRAADSFRLSAHCAPQDGVDAALRFGREAIAVTDYQAGLGILASQNSRRWRVLIVSDDDSEVSVRRAIELGVRGYLPLCAPVSAVIGAVRCIHTGGTAIDTTFIAKIAASLASPSLTGREIEVLRLMMLGLPNKAIAAVLKRSLGTAKSHVKAILAKLDAATRVEAVAVARRRGLISDDAIQMPVGRLAGKAHEFERRRALGLSSRHVKDSALRNL
ncbi:response regulator transcription factor [Povalibacter sp.]|uniref:response regulator transcription factor n=1 Tax=Povalibacter sp. TaxID=1962978 RepID=UPI002F42CC9B